MSDLTDIDSMGSSQSSDTPAASGASTSSGAPLVEPESTNPRAIKEVITARRVTEGAGFVVRRPLGNDGFTCSPFLMLDHFGPVVYPPGEAVGAPDHPHRGQETISYLLAGSMDHQDSRGGKGHLDVGDVQWMTAGSGLIHSEMPSAEMMANGGTMEGFQIWVNLPAKHKMTRPKYQEIKARKIPTFTDEAAGVTVKVIAGRTRTVSARINTFTPIVYYDICLAGKGDHFTQHVPEDHTGFVYVYRGAGKFGTNGLAGKEGQLLSLDKGDSLRLENAGGQELKVLLLAGVPIHEPVVWEGPFVMNTRGEIQDAIRDYHRGKFGEIKGAKERHEQAKAALKKSGGPKY